MAALSTEDANLVRQKALHYAAQQNGGDPMLALILKAFFRHMSEDRGNPDLEFVPFADLTSDTVLASGALSLYFLYARKQNTATDAFLTLTDHATVSDGSAGFLQLEQTVATEESYAVFRKGLAQALGITANSSTTVGGTTDSTSGDGADGFVIMGA